jgi:hypothetical protein
MLFVLYVLPMGINADSMTVVPFTKIVIQFILYNANPILRFRIQPSKCQVSAF